MIVLALAGVGLATIVSAFATDFAALLAARFAAGVFGAFGPASVMAAVGLWSWRQELRTVATADSV